MNCMLTSILASDWPASKDCLMSAMAIEVVKVLEAEMKMGMEVCGVGGKARGVPPWFYTECSC